MKYLIFIIIIILNFGCEVKNENVNDLGNTIIKDSFNIELKKNWDFSHVEDKKIMFKNGESYETNLFDLKYIGELSAKNKAPFLILSGRSCDSCDENISIFIQSPSDGFMKKESEQPRYSYPGQEFDYATNDLIFESRMFLGKYAGFGPSIIWIQKDLINKPQNSIMILFVKDNKLTHTYLPFQSQTVDEIIKSCSELKGIKTTSEP